MRVWFNRWFTTAFHLINLMKQGNPDQFTFIGSNENDIVVYKNVCDEWYVEPKGLSDEEYVSYCLDFCKQQRIDIFIPRKKLLVVSKAYAKFQEAGVRLMVDEKQEILTLLEDKERRTIILV